MNNYTPVQQTAITYIGNMALAAGAGSGKTRVLVERYVHILRTQKSNCDNIFAVTFTNKAAKEMKERIRDQIKILLKDSHSGNEQVFLEKTKQQLEYAPISTIHSLCGRILRDNPVEAVLDPNFSVLDEVQADLLLKETVNDVLRRGANTGAEWLDKLAYSYGKKSLSGAFVTLYKKCELQIALQQFDLESLLTPYRQGLNQEASIKEKLKTACQDLLAANSGNGKKTLHAMTVENIREHWMEVEAAIDRYGNSDDSQSAEHTLEQYLGSLTTRAKDKEIVAEIQIRYEDLKQLALTQTALKLMPALHHYLLEISENFAKKKNSLHALTYNDLEQRTWKLLYDNKTVCRKYQERIHHMMVDEFQDTNDLQRQIVYLLCGGDAEILYGEKLFVVGDPKQSIYRFRGADVSVFDRVCRDIAAGGGMLLDLDTNFRSVAGLLEVFNDVFADLMGTSDDLVKFNNLQAHRFCSEDLPCVELRVIDKGSLAPEDEGVEKQAEALAQRIRAMVDRRENVIRQGEKTGPVSFRDIAILFSASATMPVYEAALQRNRIPYYIFGGRGFYRCQEICDMLNLMRVVDNCYNETALVGVLRSPFFMLSDETLLYLKMQGGALWQGLKEVKSNQVLPEEQQNAAHLAWQTISKLRHLCGFVKVADLLKLALAETGYAELALTEFMGLQVYANIYKLIAIAEEFHAEDFATLNDFLQYIETLASQQADEGAEQIESEAGDTVKLMTVHKAKGLQFPVVFLPELQRRFHEDTALAIFDPSQGIGLKVPDSAGAIAPTRLYQDAAARERKYSFLEMKRLFYVAVTRAQDYLVLYTIMETSKITVQKDFLELNTFFKWLGKICGFEDADSLPDALQPGKGKILVYRDAPETVSLSDITMDPEDSIQNIAVPDPGEISDFIAALKPVREQKPDTVRFFSASSLQLYRHCPRAFFYRYVAGMPALDTHLPASSPGASAPAHLVGLAIHRFYETVRPEDDLMERLMSAAREAVPAEWVDEVAKVSVPLALQCRRSDFFRGITERIWRREWRFNYYLNQFSFTGSVDCLLAYPDGTLGIVDYKTDLVDSAGFAAKVEEYRWQLGLYALAAEAVHKRPVKDARLYFVRLDKTAEVPVGNEQLLNIQQELTNACTYIADHHDEADYLCNSQWCCFCEFTAFCPGSQSLC
ncbi:MAG: hypothetical protein H6Q66_1226 [Firmicutes bacterium]|nr:hypothetical protein [Bacillota bacterium]